MLARGRIGETYHVSGANERRNIDVVRAICGELDRRLPRAQGSHSGQSFNFQKIAVTLKINIFYTICRILPYISKNNRQN